MKISAFARYGAQAASTRQRLLQFVPGLRDAGIEVEWTGLLDDDYVRALGTGEKYPRGRIAGSYARRLWSLLSEAPGDLTWVYVDLFPYIPAWLESLLLSRRGPVVFDMDDAFFLQYDDHRRSLVRTMLGGKLGRLLSRADAVTCGNPYLRDYAARFCERAIVVPTVVDTSQYTPRSEDAGPPLIIGWIGSSSTWPNVRPLLPLLRQLCRNGDVRFRVIGAGAGAEADKFDGLDLVDWSEATEVAEVQRMDIGIMPLFDHPFQRGKSGYKLIQYMACGLPIVASPVGVNCDLVREGTNGFLAVDAEQWGASLGRLIADRELRQRFGAAGRILAEESYSLSSQLPRLSALFGSVVEGRSASAG